MTLDYGANTPKMVASATAASDAGPEPITPPPSTDILPRDPQDTGSEISSLQLPPAASTKAYQTRNGRASRLPPPPMRSRRIIQIQPVLPKPEGSPGSGTAMSTSSSTVGTTTTRARRGTGSSVSRKTARKIAHSAIERRRRSKMNEEFEALKTLVPACRVAVETHGEASLHKLGILQATVEYMKYLEQCLTNLQERIDDLEGNQVDYEHMGGVTGVDAYRDAPAADMSGSMAGVKAEGACERLIFSGSVSPSTIPQNRSISDMQLDDNDDSDDVHEIDDEEECLHAQDDDEHIVESDDEGHQVSRTLLMLRQASTEDYKRGIRVSDLLG
ncbi:hypothetical protein V1511DRAFT_488854 [Dipodascopsis uninucleata]